MARTAHDAVLDRMRIRGVQQANPEHRRGQDDAGDAQHVHDRSRTPDLGVGGLLDRYRPEHQQRGDQRDVGSHPR